jgi:hypothetical protein
MKRTLQPLADDFSRFGSPHGSQPRTPELVAEVKFLA